MKSILIFDDIVKLLSVTCTDAFITLKIPSTNQLQEIKTCAREYVKLFERGIVKTTFFGKSLFFQEL